MGTSAGNSAALSYAPMAEIWRPDRKETREGAHSLPRILHAHGDATGWEIAGSLLRHVRGLAGVELVTPDVTVVVGPGGDRLRLEADTFTVSRALTGRRSTAQIAALPWEGDPTPYLAVFDTSPIRPPADDILE